jgi:hypothetical protein
MPVDVLQRMSACGIEPADPWGAAGDGCSGEANVTVSPV